MIEKYDHLKSNEEKDYIKERAYENICFFQTNIVTFKIPDEI